MITTYDAHPRSRDLWSHLCSVILDILHLPIDGGSPAFNFRLQFFQDVQVNLVEWPFKLSISGIVDKPQKHLEACQVAYYSFGLFELPIKHWLHLSVARPSFPPGSHASSSMCFLLACFSFTDYLFFPQLVFLGRCKSQQAIAGS